MYVQDYDETFPIFHAYNTAASGAAPGKPGHKGVEDEIMPYSKNTGIFKCPTTWEASISSRIRRE
jgi:hypothetical protein